MRKAGNEIDKVRNSQSPINALPAKIRPAIMAARTATFRRAASGKSCVTPMKLGTSPMGSTTSTSVTKAEMRNSAGMQAWNYSMMHGDGAVVIVAQVNLCSLRKLGCKRGYDERL